MALGAASAHGQTTFEFTGDGNGTTWGDRFNWNPTTGPPVRGDTAIIPSGKTCKVKDGNRVAEFVEVYGTLGIESRQLEIEEALTVDGTVYLKKPSAQKPILWFSDLTFPVSKITGSARWAIRR